MVLDNYQHDKHRLIYHDQFLQIFECILFQKLTSHPLNCRRFHKVPLDLQRHQFFLK